MIKVKDKMILTTRDATYVCERLERDLWQVQILPIDNEDEPGGTFILGQNELTDFLEQEGTRLVEVKEGV